MANESQDSLPTTVYEAIEGMAPRLHPDEAGDLQATYDAPSINCLAAANGSSGNPLTPAYTWNFETAFCQMYLLLIIR